MDPTSSFTHVAALCCLVILSVFVPEVQGDLVQYWPFDDAATNAASDTAQNAVGGGNVGELIDFDLNDTPNDAPGDWVTTDLPAQLAHSTGALDFDPLTNGYVDGGNLGVVANDLGGEATVSLWYKARTLPLGAALGEDGDRLFSFGGDVTCCNEAVDGGGVVRIDEFGALHVWPGGGGWRPVTSEEIVEDEWHHIALVWEGDQVTGYINGEEGLTATSRFDFDTDLESTRTFGIGARYNTGGNFFGRTPDGTMDDVAVWNEALSAADIASLASGTPPASVAADPFDITWVAESSGLWDRGSNWSSDAVPSSPERHDVVIAPASPLLVFGPDEDRAVRSLTISGANLPADTEGFVELRLAGPQLSVATGITVASGGRISGDGTVNAIVTLSSGSEMVVLSGDSLVIPLAMPNDGTITAHGEIIFSSAFMNNAGGTINIVGGTLNVNGGLTNQGRLNLIDATVNGSVDGAVAVMALAGNNAVVGDAAGNLNLQIEIRDRAGDHDMFTVTGNAALSGTLDVRTRDDVSDPDDRGARDEYVLVTAGQRSGAFETVLYNGTALEATFPSADGSFRSHQGNGLFRNVSYTETSVILSSYFAVAGDSNGDREFNTSDLVQVFQVGKYEDRENDNADWTEGDWNGDRDFNTSDLVTAFQAGHFEQGPVAAGQAVPEPSGLIQMAITFGGLLIVNGGLRRRRSAAGQRNDWNS